MSENQGRPLSAIDRLILEAATGARRLPRSELLQVRAQVARAGFAPGAQARAGGALAGILWQGRPLTGSDRLTPAEVHYLRHVVLKREWPNGTTLQDYLHGIAEVVLDPTSGVLTSRYYGAWQLTFDSGRLRGPEGYEWVLVDYRVELGHWVTPFQPGQGLLELRSPQREEVRWLQQPR